MSTVYSSLWLLAIVAVFLAGCFTRNIPNAGEIILHMVFIGMAYELIQNVTIIVANAKYMANKTEDK